MGKHESLSITSPKASSVRWTKVCFSRERAQHKSPSNARKLCHPWDARPQQSLIPGRDKTSFWCKLHHLCNQRHKFSPFQITQSHSRLRAKHLPNLISPRPSHCVAFPYFSTA